MTAAGTALLMQAAPPTSCRAPLLYRNDDPAIVQPASAKDYLEFATTGAVLQKRAVYGVSYSCAPRVDHYEYDTVTLRDGPVLRVPDEGGALTASAGQRPSPRFPSSDRFPTIDGRRPVSVTELERERRMIGVWPTASGSILATFTAGGDAPPQVLATSRFRIATIAYQAAPHGGRGVLFFVARDGEGTRLVQYRWDHMAFG